MSFETTRRHLLKGVALGAGATLLSPVLSRLAAHAAGDEQRAAPRRVIFVVQSNGLHQHHVTPEAINAPQDRGNRRPTNDTLFEAPLADHALPSAIEPFTPFKNRLTVLRGLSSRISEGGSGGHSTNHGALGCYPGGRILGQTIDLALGDVFTGLYRHLGLGILSRPEAMMNYSLCADGPDRPAPIQCNPELAYRSLFGSVAGGNSRQDFDRRTNLLDFMADDIRRARAALAGEERQKLDPYLEAFETLHQRQAHIERIQERLRAHAPRLEEHFRRPTETMRLEAQFELAAAAVITGLSNVVTLASGGGGQQYLSFPDLGIPVDGHHYGHGGGTNGKSYEECFVTVRQFHARLIADMCRKLQAVREGNGSVLDNTLIVYLSDSGESHHPNLYDWPVVLIGNLGGRLRTGGRYLQFPRYQSRNHRTLSNLYLTLLQAAGRPRERFGIADPGLRDLDQSGSIPELLA
ncbi:MAG: DUF1552 domain-containing protein [Gemmataceae bacterium]|nr:DUF1552 domain-containing protein [Gemmataceae bacterium]